MNGNYIGDRSLFVRVALPFHLSTQKKQKLGVVFTPTNTSSSLEKSSKVSKLKYRKFDNCISWTNRNQRLVHFYANGYLRVWFLLDDTGYGINVTFKVNSKSQREIKTFMWKFIIPNLVILWNTVFGFFIKQEYFFSPLTSSA